MNRHPAHQIAQTVMYAAEELRGYMNPDDPFPWELNDDDHLDLLPHLRKAVWDIAECLNGIAQATPDERARANLAESIENLQVGCDGIELAERDLTSPEPEPGPTTQPAALAASSFPQPMTGHTLQAATSTPAPPASRAARTTPAPAARKK